MFLTVGDGLSGQLYDYVPLCFKLSTSFKTQDYYIQVHIYFCRNTTHYYTLPNRIFT